MSTTAVAYLRVSTDDQSLGLEAQRQLITRYAEAHDISVIAWEQDEGVSGGAALEDRLGLMRALAQVEACKAPVLLVAKRDRVARDVLTACTIERSCAKLGAAVVCADGAGNGDSAEAVFMRRIIDAAAEYERALIRGRIKAALAVKRERGERVGAVPYGWREDGGRLVEDEGEQAAIAIARTLRSQGVSYRHIGVTLLELGDHRPRAGGEWHPQQIARMVEAR